MRFRNLRNRATGQWLDVLFTVDGNIFSVSQRAHRDQIAQGWGIAPVDLEVLDSSADARTGVLFPAPVPSAPPPDPDLAAFDSGTAVQKFAILRRRVLER